MKRFNLAPPGALERQRAVQRMTTWGRICVAYAVIVLGGWAVVVAATPPVVDQIEGQLTEARDRMAGAEEQSSSLRRRLSEEALRLRRIEQIRRIPDWSALFILVGSQLGSSIYLEDFSLEIVGADKAPGDNAPRRFALSLTGVTREQTAITDFVLSLERSDLFQRVDLLQQQRRTLGDLELIVFNVECLLEDRKEPAR